MYDQTLDALVVSDVPKHTPSGIYSYFFVLLHHSPYIMAQVFEPSAAPGSGPLKILAMLA